jgi:hypothetical protein
MHQLERPSNGPWRTFINSFRIGATPISSPPRKRTSVIQVSDIRLKCDASGPFIQLSAEFLLPWRIDFNTRYAFSNLQWEELHKCFVVSASNYFLQIHYQLDSKCQIYATFIFGALKGMMRLCPQEALIPRRNSWEGQVHLQYFEDACILGREQLFGSKQCVKGLLTLLILLK